MIRKSIRVLAAVGSASVLLCAAGALARDSSFAQIARGRYLVDAVDCKACHTEYRSAYKTKYGSKAP